MRGCYVTRKIDFGENYLNISDLIDGKYEKAVSRLHFHPSLLVTLNRNILNASSEHFRLTCNLKINLLFYLIMSTIREFVSL